MDILESVQLRARKVFKEKHHPVCRKWLGALWFFSSEEKTQGQLISGQIAVGRVQRRQNLAAFAARTGATGHKMKWEFSAEHREPLFCSEGD